MSDTLKITTLLFDWDGTLVDSAAKGLLAFQWAFAELGVPFPIEVYESIYSPNWYSIYEALNLPKEQWERADELWLQHYGEQAANLIDGAATTLLNLSSRGYRLGVVSSGSERRVCREIERSDLRDCFEVLICNEQMVNKKPHPEGLETALRHLGRSSSEAAYVGDAPQDIQMGKHANVMTIGVRSAYPTSVNLLSAQPDLLLETISELSQHFHQDHQRQSARA